MNNNIFEQLYKKYFTEVVTLRRYFHMYPELSNQEFNTQKKIIEVLKKHGIVAKKIAKTGVVGLIKGAKPGKTVLLRADIDALPVTEETGVDWSSKNKGIMHACGHDSHIANLLFVLFILNDVKNELKGNVKFLFQPAEEAANGAVDCIRDGIMKDPKVDYVLGMHVDPSLEANTIVTKPNGWWAGTEWFEITIIGKGGHGAYPHTTIDPINVAAQFINSAQNIITRRQEASKPVILSFCSIHSGTRFNIIPDTCVIEGTIRTFSKENRKRIIDDLQNVCNGVCKANNAKNKIIYKATSKPLINDPKLTELFAKSATNSIGKDFHLVDTVQMVGDDFADFNEIAPSLYFMAGTREKGKDYYPLHNSKHIFKEENLFPASTKVMVFAVFDLLI